ncbi:TadE/TadG family type IV pilus assembly protein [Methyloligella solikamskensis]|uniref:TadE/TadG family type IV pilus assembly protein n=1 Tax=Methyloligella solikamskensis TaxID=1177756 RepID=A0ABW3JE82_9HYPH
MLRRSKAGAIAARYWRGAKQECRGTSAIEFAIILPLMLTAYLGAVEVGNMLTLNRRTDQVAYTVADLTAQVRTLSNAQIKNITDAATAILTPYSTKDLSIVLTSVVADDKNRPKVAWSCSNGNGAPLAKNSSVDLPEGLTAPGSSVIMADVQYAYVPLFGEDAPFLGSTFGKFTMSRKFYSRPRRSATVDKTDNGCPG